jgi:hypothetical protein
MIRYFYRVLRGVRDESGYETKYGKRDCYWNSFNNDIDVNGRICVKNQEGGVNLKIKV